MSAGETLGASVSTNKLEWDLTLGDSHYCPALFFLEAAQDDLEGRITTLMAAVESFRGDDELYDEEVMALPGCLAESQAE